MTLDFGLQIPRFTWEALRPRSSSPEAYAAAVQAGTVEDHIGRFRSLADAMLIGRAPQAGWVGAETP